MTDTDTNMNIDTFLKKNDDASFDIDTLLNKIITTDSDTEINDIKTKIRQLYDACNAENKTDDAIVAAMTALNTAYQNFTPPNSTVYPNYDKAKTRINQILESMSSEE
jgi:hypothetical protein